MSKKSQLDCMKMAIKIERIAKGMHALADEMRDFSKGDCEVVNHAQEMDGAATIAETWAKAIWDLWRDAK